VILPLAALAAMGVTEVVNGIEWTRAALATGGVAGLVARLPAPVQRVAQHFLADLPGLLSQLQDMAASQGGRAAAAVGGLVTATTAFVIQATLMLVALFFLLVDGRRLLAWLDEVIPLQPGQVFELLGDFRKVTVAVLHSTLVTASVQTLVALAGYVIGRVPNTLFFTLVTFLVALVPVLGGSVGVILVALLELATGHTGVGIFLLAWVVPVSLTDTLVKPLLMSGKGGLEIHGAVIFFSLLGGIAAFGLVGVLIGPLVVAFLVAVLRMARRDAGAPPQAQPPVTPSA
jgi:predicted PurR-regulated permease PerM